MKKSIIFLLFILFIFGCSSKHNNTPDLYAIRYDGNPTSEFQKHNLRYKIEIIDTRWYSQNQKDILEKRSLFKEFGEYLGDKAIVIDNIRPSSKKREQFNQYQHKCSTNYNLDNDAPFLIFYKKSKFSKRDIPYKILSLSTNKLREKLSLLSDAISEGKSDSEVYQDLEKIKFSSNRTIQNLINILQEWFN